MRSKAAVTIDGGNYGRPYPPEGGSAALPPPNPLSRTGAPDRESRQAPGWLPAAVPADASTGCGRRPAAAGRRYRPRWLARDPEWLGVIGAAQEQAAQAHAEFQRAMTESHLAYLRMAEVTFAGLLSAASGETPPALLPPVPPPPPLAQVAPAQAPLPDVPPPAPVILPAASAGPEVAAAAGPAASSPPGPAAGRRQVARPRRTQGRRRRWCPAAGGGRGADRLSG